VQGEPDLPVSVLWVLALPLLAALISAVLGGLGAAPTMMAIAASGPTITCRELVNNANATMPPRAAYNPEIGGHFARSA
jgi:hypothetical protein